MEKKPAKKNLLTPVRHSSPFPSGLTGGSKGYAPRGDFASSFTHSRYFPTLSSCFHETRELACSLGKQIEACHLNFSFR